MFPPLHQSESDTSDVLTLPLLHSGRLGHKTHTQTRIFCTLVESSRVGSGRVRFQNSFRHIETDKQSDIRWRCLQRSMSRLVFCSWRFEQGFGRYGQVSLFSFLFFKFLQYIGHCPRVFLLGVIIQVMSAGVLASSSIRIQLYFRVTSSTRELSSVALRPNHT